MALMVIVIVERELKECGVTISRRENLSLSSSRVSKTPQNLNIKRLVKIIYAPDISVISRHHLCFAVMRPPKACLQCRSGKRRCDLVETGSACQQCIQRNLSCSAVGAQVELQVAPPVTFIPSPTPVVSCGNEEILQLVDLYFTFMHDKPHTLFHEPSFRSSISDGTVSRQVLLSMMGLSAR
jgi:hypothetical protein